MIRSKKVTRSAQGQPCFLQLPGICNFNWETTVWAHLNGAAFGKGAGIKAHDIAGFPACSDCHFAYDQHKTGLTDAELSQALLRATVGAWVMLIERGIVIVPVDADPPKRPMTGLKLDADKRKKAREFKGDISLGTAEFARKPKDQRTPIPKRKDPWPKRGWAKREEGG